MSMPRSSTDKEEETVAMEVMEVVPPPMRTPEEIRRHKRATILPQKPIPTQPIPTLEAEVMVQLVQLVQLVQPQVKFY